MSVGRWFIYALGGGLGHLSRSIALARAGVKAGRQVRIVSNSPLACAIPQHSSLLDQVEIITLDPHTDKRSIRQEVLRIVSRGDYDRFIVDTFPRGLGGELADVLTEISCPRVLVHRDINPAYIEKFDLVRWANLYDLILQPGETGPFGMLPHSVMTKPWLLLDSTELQDRATARRQLECSDVSLPLVLVSGSGRADEIERAARFATRVASEFEKVAAVRFAGPLESNHESTPSGHTIHWPLLELMNGVDVLIGGGGYNTVNEARATSTPLLALPMRRLYDRQHKRLSPP